MNWLRHKRTVSSHTPNASERRELVQPLSVKRMLLALSASARSDPPALASSSLTCSGVARSTLLRIAAATERGRGVGQ